MNTIKRLIRDERGAAAIEYALIASLVSIAGITSMTVVGTDLTTIWSNLKGHLDSAAAGP